MDIEITPGTYVVAVSGGVDSMVLLDILHHRASIARPGSWHLTVAHFDHGIRPDSAEDRRLVQATARAYQLPFVYAEGNLGPASSEATAREARYAFLRRVRQAGGAQAVITAHHQDDVLETAILNLLRGTGRKGLSSLASRPGLLRPLLSTPKQSLIKYARSQGLVWREDSTNTDLVYLRNYVRRRLLPRFDDVAREELVAIISKLQEVNRELDELLANQLHMQSVAGTIDRQWFNQLPHSIAREVVAAWLRAGGIRDFDRKTLERLVINAKVGKPGQRFPITHNHYLRIGREHLALVVPER